MRKVKFFLAILLASLFAGISGISSKDVFAQERRMVKVLTSFYPVYIMALNVTKDVPGVSAASLTPPSTGCLHDYALTSVDMKKIADADIFITNGAGMEPFIEGVVKEYPKLKFAILAEGISLIKEGKQTNPHVWVSISNAIIEVKNFGKIMERYDPLHAELYLKNTAVYVSKLEALRQKMQSELAPYKGRQVVTFHEAFPYFAEEFGLKIAAAVERNPGSEPSAKELAEAIDLIKKTGIRAIFGEPQYSFRAAQIIAKETGAKLYILDPAVTGPNDTDAYIKIMEYNLRVLKEALR